MMLNACDMPCMCHALNTKTKKRPSWDKCIDRTPADQGSYAISSWTACRSGIEIHYHSVRYNH